MSSKPRFLSLSAVLLCTAALSALASPAPGELPNHGGTQPQYRQTLKAERAACLQAAAQHPAASTTLKQNISACRKN